MTLDDAGAPLGRVNYDPWGNPENGTVPTFGFTGELQDAATGLVNLRARWYSTTSGTFTSRDSFAGYPEEPYSLHPYAYGYSDPVLLTDPSGWCSRTGDDYCYDTRPTPTPTPPTPLTPTPTPTPTPCPTPTLTPLPIDPDFTTMDAWAFIAWVAPMAQRTRQLYHVPTAVTIAQAMYETGVGATKEARFTELIDVHDGRRSRNLFGIRGVGPAGSVQATAAGENPPELHDWRAYNTYQESVLDHGRLLATSQNYAVLWQYVNDPIAFATAFNETPYAGPAYGTGVARRMHEYLLEKTYQDTPVRVGVPATPTPMAARSRKEGSR
jgi:RHS repeat-associated protein